MFSVETSIFKLFGTYDKRTDINIDVNGKGTLERFNELVGYDIDTNLLPFIDNLLANVYVPKTAFNSFIAYLETGFGVQLFFDQTITTRRAILGVIQRINSIRGTRRAYTLLFGMLGLSIVLTESFIVYGFDSPVTFDDDDRVFDSSTCPACTSYSLDITGPGVVTPFLPAIRSIIAYNEPINALLRGLTYNTIPFVL